MDDDWVERILAAAPRAKRVSRSDCYIVLSGAKSSGHIFSYRDVRTEDGTRWVIETVPTRYEHYNDPNARGIIVLKPREVMAFMEGIYAAERLVNADERKLVEGERRYPVHRAGDFLR